MMPKFCSVDFILRVLFQRFQLQLEILIQYMFEIGCNFK